MPESTIDPEFDTHHPAVPLFACTIFLVGCVVLTGLFILYTNERASRESEHGSQVEVTTPQKRAISPAIPSPKSINPTLHSSYTWTVVATESELGKKALIVQRPTGDTIRALKGTEWLASVVIKEGQTPPFLALTEFYQEELTDWSKDIVVNDDHLLPFSADTSLENVDGYIRIIDDKVQVLLFSSSKTVPGTSVDSSTPTQLRVFESEPFEY